MPRRRNNNKNMIFNQKVTIYNRQKSLISAILKFLEVLAVISVFYVTDVMSSGTIAVGTININGDVNINGDLVLKSSR